MLATARASSAIRSQTTQKPSGTPSDSLVSAMSTQAIAHRHRPPVPDALPDPVQAVATGFNLLGRGMQRPAERRLTGKELVHASRSSTVRSVAMARAVWLLTAPLLICMASAI